MVGKVNVTSLSIIPITSDDFNENTLCILKWSKESVSRQGLLTQQMNDPLHLQWESTIEALCPSDQSDSKNVLDNVESLFWKVELVLDCMNANQVIGLGQTEEIRNSEDTTFSFLTAPMSIDINIDGSMFPQQHPNKLALTNISLLRLTLMAKKESIMDKENNEGNEKNDTIEVGHQNIVFDILQDRDNSLLRRIYSPFQ